MSEKNRLPKSEKDCNTETQQENIDSKIAECYQKYYKRLVVVSSNTIANKLNLPLDEAKEIGTEISSEAFTVLCEKYSTINEEHIYTWLYKVAENLTNNFIRKYFSEMRHMNVSVDDEAQNESLKNLSTEAEEYDVREIGEKFLKSLTPDERKEYELFFCSDMSLKEIAKKSNVEYSAVRQHKSRLLAKLKKKLLALICVF